LTKFESAFVKLLKCAFSSCLYASICNGKFSRLVLQTVCSSA